MGPHRAGRPAGRGDQPADAACADQAPFRPDAPPASAAQAELARRLRRRQLRWALLATSLGLVLAMSGAIAHDLAPGSLRRLRYVGFAVAAGGVLLAPPAELLDVGPLVTSAFAVAASTFCPLLVLGIWWSGLTRRGAMAGMAVGLVTSAGAIFVELAVPVEEGLVVALLLTSPALCSVPLAFTTMIVVSLRTDPRLGRRRHAPPTPPEAPHTVPADGRPARSAR